MKKGEVVVIGAGFAGFSAAICLANKGFNVKILEKNPTIGGRARQFTDSGFTFDMGPSWYWMPDVFESFFNQFGKTTADYYELIRLDPSYQVIHGKNDYMPIPANMHELERLFDSIELGAGEQLRKFLKIAEYKYEVGINKFVYKPSRSILEFANPKLAVDAVRLQIFQSMAKHVRKFFKNERLIQLMEFPVLFLGALPENTPAMYSLMNYADMALGTWYPKGGMFKIIEALESLAKEKGVEILTDHEVTSINYSGKRATSVSTNHGDFKSDVVVAGADYHHVDSMLLDSETRNYDETYWDKRVMAPSSLLYYVGVNKKLEGLLHHNLFFDTDFAPHAHNIYTEPKWPEKPLFYVSAPSKTDNTVAPEGCENIFMLIPVAPGLDDTEDIRAHYFDLMLERMKDRMGLDFKENIVFKRSFAHKDFVNDYNAFKGNAYGLANTLNQTAILKPQLANKKLNNLFYTGQLTVPGPGVPPSLISGQVVAKEIIKDFG